MRIDEKAYRSIVLNLIAYTVVSTAGLMTAQKAAATPTESRTQTVNYQAGKTHSFTSSKFNANLVQFDNSIGRPQHYEFTKKGTAYALITFTETQSGYTDVQNGIVWQLKGVSDADMTKPCTITVKPAKPSLYSGAAVPLL